MHSPHFYDRSDVSEQVPDLGCADVVCGQNVQEAQDFVLFHDADASAGKDDSYFSMVVSSRNVNGNTKCSMADDICLLIPAL